MFPRIVLALAACLVSLFPTAPVSAQDVRAFATPEDAVASLIEALRAPTLKPLEEIFGTEILASVPPEERRSDAARRAAGEGLAGGPVKIEYDDSERTRAHAIVGSENFRLPTPLMRVAAGWVFDGKAGIAEMNERRIDINEANAIRALHAL